MNIKAKGVVSIPRPPMGLGGVLTYCRGVSRALQQLQDRTWTTSSRGRGSPSGAVSVYIPWKPRFFTETSGEDTIHKCRFNLGTLNDVCASNWDTDHTLPSDDSVRFVMLEVTTEDGKVTGLEIQLEEDAPIEDTVLKDTPPPVWKILLGVVDKLTGSMLETTNLSAVAVEIYRESKTTTSPGGEPFSRYWRWSHDVIS